MSNRVACFPLNGQEFQVVSQSCPLHPIRIVLQRSVSAAAAAACNRLPDIKIVHSSSSRVTRSILSLASKHLHLKSDVLNSVLGSLRLLLLLWMGLDWMGWDGDVRAGSVLKFMGNRVFSSGLSL